MEVSRELRNKSRENFKNLLPVKSGCSVADTEEQRLVHQYFISRSLPSELKQLNWLSVVGLLMVLCGEGLRKAAMLTAGSNFNHIVQNEKAQSHVLVTSGVYSYFRHPSYVGWFYWSIGTQVSYVSTTEPSAHVILS